jgi:flavodoxin I
MKAVVAYDSATGCTETIARAIAEGLGPRTAVVKAGRSAVDPKAVDLLVVGSPVYGGRPTPNVIALLESLPAGSLEGIKVASFDTRMTMFIAKLFGWAAVRIMDRLVTLGGTPVAEPEGFIVEGRSGPLAAGEKERAAAWGRRLAGAAGGA